MQPAFLLALIEAFNNMNIHTAIETCGYSTWEVLNSVSKKVDLIYYDFKLLDEADSIKYTGAPNSLILDNLERLVNNGINVRVRMPIIPSVNDSPCNIEKTAKYLKSIGIESIELLPYHNLGTAKYEGLDLQCNFQEKPLPALKQLKQVSLIFHSNGIMMTSEV